MAFAPTDDGIQERDLPFDQLSAYASEAHRVDASMKARSIVVEAPIDALQGGLVLVDTPGVGGLDRTHSEVTFAALADADLVLFASDVNRPLTTAELEFIETRIAPLGRQWILVQTKADLSVSADRIIGENRAKLRERLPEHWADAPIFAVSSLNKVDHLSSNDPQDLTDSGFLEFEREVRSTLEKTGVARVIVRALEDVEAIDASVRKPLEAELAGLERDGSPEVARWRGELESAERRLASIDKDAGQWRADLVQRIRNMEGELLNRVLPAKTNELQRAMRRRMASDEVAMDFDDLARKLEDDAKAALLVVTKEIVERSERLRDDFEIVTQISLSAFNKSSDADLVPIAPDVGGDVVGPSAMSRAAQFGRNYSIHFVGLTFAGGVFGGVAGAGIGLATGGPLGAYLGFQQGAVLGGGAGNALGLATGWSSAREKMREKIGERRFKELKEVFEPFIDDVKAMLRTHVEDSVRELVHAMPFEFNRKIELQREKLREEQTALAKGLSASREEAVVRRAELIRLIDRLDIIAGGAREAAAPHLSAATSAAP